MEAAFVLTLLSLYITSSTSNITITNGPQDSIICLNDKAEINCGFTGGNPEFVIPDWRIILRSDNGSIISNVTYDGEQIINGSINGLKWMPDRSSGENNATNSKLLVGPVNKTQNCSSYQCIIRIPSINNRIKSSEGIITVVGPPSTIISEDEKCITSFNISLNFQNYLACGNVSPIVTRDGEAIDPKSNNGGYKYFVDKLQSNTSYNITINSTYKSGTEITTQSVMTLLPKPPNPIDDDHIDINRSKTNITITWKPPKVDTCSMFNLSMIHYDVKINNTKDDELQSNKTNDTTISYDNLTSDMITVTITVVDIEGQRSESKIREEKPDGQSISGDNKESTNSNIRTIIVITLLSLWQLL